MKVFTCIDHQYHWPVGVASVVIAETEIVARDLLIKELKTCGIDQTEPFSLQEIDLNVAKAFVLCDGDY